jgi:Laminin G domain
MRFARTGLVLSIAALALPMGLARANAAATVLVADWEMNDAPLATVMVDNSGNGHDGAIQSNAAPLLTTGVISGPDTVFRWSNVKPNQPPATPQRVVQIDDPALNPGTKDWAISFRYRTSHPFGNIVQKGQSESKGGQIKFQLPKGQISCMFKGASGARKSVKTINAYDDNQWHVVRCERTAAGVTMTVDGGAGAGGETRTIRGATGNLSNTIPMTVGGKINCDQHDITCDYFAGDIDWVKVESS